MEENDKKKGSLEIFKYNIILSALFFLTSTVYLSNQIPNYNFDKYTISQMSRFLDNKQLSFFNLLFIIKCLLDLSFTQYVFNYYKGKLNFFSSLVWLIATLSFGLIGFFPVHQYKMIHWLLAGSLFLFWTITQHIFSKITGSEKFEYFTNNLILIQFLTVILFFVFSKINGVFEIVYFFFIFIWQILFISLYLK